MAKYRVKTETGTYLVTTDDAAQPEKQGFLDKAKEALRLPEQMSREGLTALANVIPDAETTDVTNNILLNTPKFLTEVAAETAPDFVSPESIVTAGALKVAKAAAPVIKGVGKYVGKGLEGLSGLEYKTPGILAEAFNDPTLIFSKGIESARRIYQQAKGLQPAIREELKTTLDKGDFIQKSIEIAKNGALSADEALEARKTLDSIRKRITDEGYRAARQIFDDIAKTKFAEADVSYTRAVKGETLRSILPTNKTSGTSVAKTTLGGFVPPLGIAMSPVVQGAAATAAGGVARAVSNPTIGASVGALNRERFEKLKSKRRGKN